MATVNVEVKVEAPGLSSAQKHAEQLHNSLKGAATAAATIRVPTPVRTAQAAMPNAAPTATDTNLSRGVAGVSGASGRDFAKQAQGLGGLVHVYATFAANLFAVSAAFGALSRAADTTNIIKGLDQLGAVSGRSLGNLAKQMVQAADGAISLRDAMSSTAMSTAAGMSSANILRMTEVAKKASLALGRDMPDSMDRLTKGIAKVQPELLDELGIMARVIPSQETYARQLGKSVSALTDFEKKQAFANAVLEEGERKFGNIQIDANPYSQLLASMTNVAQTGLELFNKVLTPILNILSSNPTALAAVMAGLGAILLKQAIPALGQFKQSLEDAAIFANKKAQEAYLNQQLSSGKLDDITRQSIERKTKIQQGYFTKVESLESNAAKFSRSSSVDWGTRLTTNLKDTTDKELKIWEGRAKRIQGTNAVEAALIRDQIAGVLDLRRINTVAEAEANAVSDRRIKSAEKIFSQQSSLRRLSEAADRSASKIYIAEQARQMQASEGFFAAVKNGYQNMNLARTRGTDIPIAGIIAAGDAATRLGGKLGHVAGGIALIGVTARVAAISIGTAVASFLPWLELIGLAIVGLVSLYGYLSNTTKEASATSKAIDLLNGSLDTVDKTLENINKKPLLEQLSIESIQAKANALAELVTNAKDAVEKSNIELQKLGLVSGSVNWIKNLFGGGIDKNLNEQVSKVVVKSFEALSKGPAAAAAQKTVANILGTTITTSEQLEDVLNSMSGNGRGAILALLSALQQVSQEFSVGAAKGTELRESYTQTNKVFDEFTNSLKASDSYSRLGTGLIEGASKLSIALQDPVSSLNSMLEIVNDVNKIRLFPQDTASELLAQTDALKTLQLQQANATQAIENANIKTAELSEKLNKRGGGLSIVRLALDPLFITEIIETEQKIADLEKAKTIQLDIIASITTKAEDLRTLFNRAILEQFKLGASIVSSRLAKDFAEANLTVQKGLAGMLGDTKAGIIIRAKSEQQIIAVQQEGIRTQLSLLETMEHLTVEMALRRVLDEKRAIEGSPGGSSSSPEQFTKLQKEEQKLLLREADFNKRPSYISTARDMSRGDIPIDPQRLEFLSKMESSLSQQQKLNAASKLINIQKSFELQKKTSDEQKKSNEQNIKDLDVQVSKVELLTTITGLTTLESLMDKQNLANNRIVLQTQSEILDKQGELSGLKLIEQEFTKAKLTEEAKLTKIEAGRVDAELTRLQTRKIAELNQQKNNKDTFEQSKAIFDIQQRDQETAYARLLQSQSLEQQKLTNTENLLVLYKELNVLTDANYITQKSTLEQNNLQLTAQKEIDSITKNANSKIDQAEFNIEQIKLRTQVGAAQTSQLAEQQKIIDETNKSTDSQVKLLLETLGINIKITKAKSANSQEMALQLELETKLSKAAAIRADKLEVDNAQLDFENQRLDNAKELGRITDTQYVRSKAGIEIVKQELAYKDKIRLAEEAVLAARNKLISADKNALDAKLNTGKPGESLIAQSGADATVNLTKGQTDAQNAVDLAESARKKIEDTYTIEQKRTAEQLKHNSLLVEQKNLIEKIADLTSSLTLIFGDVGTSIGDSVAAIAKFGKEYTDTQAAIDKAKAGGNQDDIIDANKKQTTAVINNLGLVAKATQGLYDKQTVGYKVLAGAEKAFSALKIGDAIKEFVTKSGLLTMWQTASAAADVAARASAAANSTASATASIPAVMMKFMAQMGPWGWAAAAAAIAALGLGVQGDSMVDMTGQTAADRQASQGTGTVTGDSTAKSQSINNSLAILNATSVEGLSYYNKMVELLTNINDGISGVAKGIYGTIGLTSGSGFGNKDSESGGFNILGGLFSSTTNKEIIDTGIAFKGTIVDFIAGSKDFVQAFENSLITSTSSFLWISSTSSRIQELLGPLDDKVTKAISKVFLNAAGTFVEVGSKLGMTVNDVMTGLSKIPLTTLVSLRGLKGQELEDALSSAFSSMLDIAASGLFVSLEKFNVMGEGMLQTAVRVVDGLDKINLGMESIGKATVGSGMTGFEISQWIIDAAGGLDKALDLTENFGSRFLTDAERLVPVAVAVTKEFTRLNISGTLTRESFKNLVQGFVVTDAASAATYASLLKLSDGVDEVLKASEALNTSIVDQSITINEKLGNTEGALRLSRIKQLDALDALLRPGQIYLNALEDEKTLKDQLITAYNKESAAIKSTISSLKASIKTLSDYKTALLTGSMTVLDPTQLYNQTKTDFNNLAAIIKAPAVTDAEKLAQTEAVSKFAAVSDRFLTASRVQFASSGNYLADFKSVSDFVDSSATLLGNQLTDAELQLQKLTASVNFLEQIKDNTKSTETLLKELKTAQATTEAARVVYEASNAGKIAAAAWNAGVETTAAVAGSTTAITSTANAASNTAVLTIDKTTSAVNTTTDAILDSDAVKAAKAQAAANTIAAALVVAEGGAVNNNGQEGVGSNTTSGAGLTNQATLSAAVSNNISTTLGQAIALNLADQLSSLNVADIAGGIYGGGSSGGASGSNTDGGGVDNGGSGGVGYRAAGGLAMGMTLVGEQGPELVDFKTPGRVYSNPASNDLLSNADLIAEIRNLHKEIAQLRKDQREQTGYLIKSNYDANQLAAQQVADATEAAAATNAWNMRSAVKIA